MHSCLYRGAVTHRRRGDVTHRFRYGLTMLYLDLDEARDVVGRRRAVSGWCGAVASFLADDHLAGGDRPLAEQARDHAERRTGRRPAGPVRLLTQLRWLGGYFSPLNLFYLFGPGGDALEAVVAEVSNTPWVERHLYVLTPDAPGPVLRCEHAKEFHVSPFLGMDARYRWRLSPPGERLGVALSYVGAGGVRLDASMALRRAELTRSAIHTDAMRRPAAAAQTLAAIYFEAFRLWRKQCRYVPHPNRAGRAA